MNIILSVDIGTATIGAVALEIDSDQIVCTHSARNTASVPRVEADQHEQDPREILGIVKGLLSQAAASVVDKFSSNRYIRGIVITGQMHGIVLVDKRNQPQSALITWRDQRAAHSSKVKDIAADSAAAKRCGCRLQPGYGFATLHKLISDDTLLLGALSTGATRVCGVTDYVAASLSNCLVTDLSMAASWGGLDIRSRDWDRSVLEVLQIPESALPPLQTSANPVAPISRTQAEELRIAPGTVICAGIGDHQSSILGCRPGGAGSCLLNVGTGGQVSVVTPQPESFRNLETRPLAGGYFVITGTSLCGGWSYEYLAEFFRNVIHECTDDQVDQDSIYEAMNRIGDRAPKNANNLVVDPLFLGSRHSPHLMGSIYGINEANLSPANLVRATANGIVDELYRYYELMQQPADHVYATGNAIRRNPLLIQAIKERWKRDPIVAETSEVAAYGAACLAAIRLGLIKSSWLMHEQRAASARM